MSTNEITNNEPFKFFKCTESIFIGCERSMDTPTTANQTDAEGNALCCGCLQCLFCWPLVIVYDILSSPVRGCIHCKNSKK